MRAPLSNVARPIAHNRRPQRVRETGHPPLRVKGIREPQLGRVNVDHTLGTGDANDRAFVCFSFSDAGVRVDKSELD